MTWRMSRGRWRYVVGVTCLLSVLTAGPAAADPPGPTNYRAEVLEIEPPTDAVEAEVLGGDSFLRLTVAEGHEALLRGYDGEEAYLRFSANGEVHVNRRSESHYQNQSRYSPGEADRPDQVGPDVPPDWELVSTTGSYAWHDHRIHWMSPTTLPFRATTDDGGEGQQVDPSLGEPQVTTVWSDPIPLTVDGEQVGIVGEVTYLPDASPVPALATAVLVLVAVVWLGRRAPATGIVVGTVTGAVVALAISVPLVVGLPIGVEAQPVQVLVPLIALLVVAAGLSVRSRSAFALVVAGAAGIPLLGWAVTNLGALSAPIVPPAVVPSTLVRVALGVVVGGGLGGLVLGIRDLLTGGALSLDPGPEPAETA